MASQTEHCADCERLLNDPCVEINRWMDDYFKRFGPLHRFMNHHTRGVREAQERFGERGRLASTIHILKDCGRIPTARQWANQEVDSLGILPDSPFKGHWVPVMFDQEAKKVLRYN